MAVAAQRAAALEPEQVHGCSWLNAQAQRAEEAIRLRNPQMLVVRIADVGDDDIRKCLRGREHLQYRQRTTSV